MITLGSGKFRLTALGLALAGLAFSCPLAAAGDGGPVVVVPPPRACANCGRVHAPSQGHHGAKGVGTLGYGPPGLHPGFQGFGLGYHPGYGYGGNALGVGAEGGYPFYGGPGYPRCDPPLRRIGGINPFPYFGGPGYPTPDHPNFYGGVGGPLVPDQPVITIESDPNLPFSASHYGDYTGSVPDPEARFAPFTLRAAAGAMSMRARYSRPPSTSMPMPAPPVGGPGSPTAPTPPATPAR
jgi:hypothetical protein